MGDSAKRGKSGKAIVSNWVVARKKAGDSLSPVARFEFSWSAA
jgi:hypothetical protein